MLHNVGFGEILDDCYAYSWLIRGVNKNILIDAGVDIELWPPMATYGEDVGDLLTSLKKEGLSPEDIDIIILTHLHHDHISKSKYFPRAKLIVQRKELEMATDSNAPPHVKRAYVQHLIQPLYDSKRFEVIDGDLDIEPGIKVLLTPGHTVGSQSVAIQSGDKVVVVTGFCCVDENFEPLDASSEIIPIGIYVNTFDAYYSMKRVKDMADVIVALHGKKFLNTNRIP
jgi:glyoxylase-like metal-dependent hydrolase (beta-lactamase superfamily II)